MRQRRVARAEDDIALEVHAQLLLERFLYVDLGQHAKALHFECRLGACHGDFIWLL